MCYDCKMIRLMQGDCLERMAEIEDGSVDLTVTSPPYDNLRSYNGNNDQWCEAVWKSAIAELYRVTKQGGVVVWVVGDATIKGSESGASFRQALHAMDCGFLLNDTMIWDKQASAFAGGYQYRCTQVFEYMFIFSKGRPATFNAIRDKKNKKAGGKKHGSKRHPCGKMKPVTGKLKVIPSHGPRHNIWRIPSCQSNRERTGHPAQMSIQIANDHIISWSNAGDTVLDPFMGSGTTGLAARNLNRDFIGIELDPDYFKIAEARIKA